MRRVGPNLYQYKTQKGRRFAVRISWHGRDQWRQGFVTKEQAKDYIDDFCAKVVAAKHLPDQVEAPRLKDYGAHWLRHMEARGLKRNTLRSYTMNLTHHVYPELGERPMDQIRRRDVQALMLRKHREGLSGNTIRLMVAPLSALYAHAIDNDVVTQNPAGRPSQILPVRRRKHELEIFTLKEERALLKQCERDRPDQYALMLTVFRAPLRIGEALALEWGDVDFAADRISITKNYTNGHLELLPKGGRSRRVVLDSQLKSVLRRAKRQASSSLVFPGGKGYLHLRSWRRWVWEKLLKRCELSHRGVHATRHTWVTNQLKAGKSLWWVKEQCGHSSIQVTVDVYGHLGS